MRKLVPFVPTPMPVVYHMLDLAGVDEGETVVDLGCGDGRILFTAAERYKAHAIGYEIRPALVNHVRQSAKIKRLDEYVQVIQADLTRANIENVDVITLYLTPDLLTQVRPRLENALRRGARIVSHDFRIPGLIPSEAEKKHGKVIYLYRRFEKI
ncbi:MAG: class I SAM-dependent methyltransferase [Candidatus Caldarchaeum sp.]